MNHPANVSDFPAEREMAPPLELPTKPLYWSLRREIWENRSITIAPLIITAFVLFGSFISVVTLPQRLKGIPAGDAARYHTVLITPFNMAPAPIMLIMFLVGFFYSLDALYGERRDRSILFWKSLPVSDRTTVLSKIMIPTVVLPLIAFALSWVTQFLLLVLATLVLPANGISPAPLWASVNPVAEAIVMFYGLAVHALWFAPINGYFLLISAWARRMPLLWAVLPLVLIGILEQIFFNTKVFPAFLRTRFLGAMDAAFDQTRKDGIIESLSQLTLFRFLITPGLWIGLLFTAAFLALAVRLRRRRDPI